MKITGTDLSWLPILAVNNMAQVGTWSASTEDSDHPALAARSPLTYSSWLPTALPAWLKVDLGAASDVDFAALYAAGASAQVTPEYSTDDIAWSPFEAQALLDYEGPHLWLPAASVNARYFRFYVETQAPFVMHAAFGLRHTLPVPPPTNFVPGAVAPEDEFATTESEGGQVLGHAYLRSMVRQDVELRGLSGAWFRQNWPQLRTLFRTRGAFFAQCPREEDADLVYGMVRDLRARHINAADLEVAFRLEGPAL